MRLILARHGQSEANVNPFYNGFDAPLTALGERQAHCLGVWLKNHHADIDRTICSPLVRAFRTAEIVNSYLNVPLEVREDLREMTQSTEKSMLRRQHPLQGDTAFLPPDNDKYYDLFRTQISPALEFFFEDLERPNTTLVVAHGGTNSTLLRTLLDRHDLRFHTFNTGLHILEWEDGRITLHALNAVRHLTEPELFTY